MGLNSLEDVLHEQVKDLLSAEKQLVAALPKVAQAAHTDELKQAINEHLEETRNHVERLEQVTTILGMASNAETCKAMQGLIAEGEEILAEQGDPIGKDAAIIAAAQRIEHYEIAAYGTARTLAGELGQSEAEQLFNETLDEESAADSKLTKIATGGMFSSGAREAMRFASLFAGNGCTQMLRGAPRLWLAVLVPAALVAAGCGGTTSRRARPAAASWGRAPATP